MQLVLNFGRNGECTETAELEVRYLGSYEEDERRTLKRALRSDIFHLCNAIMALHSPYCTIQWAFLTAYILLSWVE